MKSIPFNPYIVGNPIKSKEMFFGREDDFQFVAKKIGEGKANQILVLCGERRSGKTSILFQILGGRLGSVFLPVLIDMQMLAGIRGELDFFRSVLKAGCEALGSRGLSMERLEAEAGTPSVERLFESFLALARANAPERIVLFLFDEYELIETKIKDGSLGESAIHYLAGILESPYRVSFIFTGSTNLEDRKVDIWKSLLGKSVYRKISYLSRGDTSRLITEPLREYVSYPAGMVESIYRLTGGQPFYTQVICQNMVDLLIEDQKGQPGAEDLERIVREIVDNPLPQMIYSWNSVSEWDQIILSSLASRLADPEGWSDSEQIVHFIKTNRIVLPFKKEQVNVLLEEGYHGEFLEKGESATYRFKMDLFRRWIRREHSIWKAAKEAGLQFQKGSRTLLAAIVAAGVLAVGLVSWFFLIPRYLPEAAQRLGISSAQSRRTDGAAAADSSRPLVKGVTFIANRGPYRLSIDNEQALTSEGQRDPLIIQVPSLELGPHRIIAVLKTGEKVELDVGISPERRAFSIPFPAEAAKTAPPQARAGQPKPAAPSEAAAGTSEAAQGGAEKDTGILIINSQPPGAEVSVDGQRTGKRTPYAENIQSGDHIVSLEMEGYGANSFTATVAAGEQAKSEVSLEEVWGWITFDVRPTARISLDGKYVLDTPYVKPYRVQAGTHTLTIANEALGYSRSRTIYIREGDTPLRIQEVLK